MGLGVSSEKMWVSTLVGEWLDPSDLNSFSADPPLFHQPF